MRFKELIFGVLAVLARRTPAYRPRLGEPTTTSGRARAIALFLTTVRGSSRLLIRVVFIIVVIAAFLIPVIAYLKVGGGSRSAPHVEAVQPALSPAAAAPSSAPFRTTAAPGAPLPRQATTASPAVTTAPAVSPPTAAPVGDDVAAVLETVADARAALIQLLLAEQNGAVETWCSLATALNIAQCDARLGPAWTAQHSSAPADTAQPVQVTAGTATGGEAGYTFSVSSGEDSESETMVWDGHLWRLSDPDYQTALDDDGLLQPLVGTLTSVVTDLF